MDRSGSIGQSDWEIQRQFVSDMITTGMTNTSSVALMTFGTGASSKWNFTDIQHPRAIVTDTVENLTYPEPENTYMKTGIESAITIFDKTATNATDNLLFLITDGDPFPSWTETVCDDYKMKNKLDNAGTVSLFCSYNDTTNTGIQYRQQIASATNISIN